MESRNVVMRINCKLRMCFLLNWYLLFNSIFCKTYYFKNLVEAIVEIILLFILTAV